VQLPVLQSEAERLLAGARDLEESIGVSLSARRFEVNRLELTLSIASFAAALGAMVAGIFGMNLRRWAGGLPLWVPGICTRRRPAVTLMRRRCCPAAAHTHLPCLPARAPARAPARPPARLQHA
jgi:hypothetical protein